MKDGRSLTGIVKGQDDKSVTVVTQNETLVLPRNEIDSNQQSELVDDAGGVAGALERSGGPRFDYYLGRTGQVPLPGESN